MRLQLLWASKGELLGLEAVVGMRLARPLIRPEHVRRLVAFGRVMAARRVHLQASVRERVVSAGEAEVAPVRRDLTEGEVLVQVELKHALSGGVLAVKQGLGCGARWPEDRHQKEWGRENLLASASWVCEWG